MGVGLRPGGSTEVSSLSLGVGGWGVSAPHKNTASTGNIIAHHKRLDDHKSLH